MILWRHLIGAVTNAAYVKPFIQYDVTKSITFKVVEHHVVRARPVATPGNDTMYGTEFDADLGYTVRRAVHRHRRTACCSRSAR